MVQLRGIVIDCTSDACWLRGFLVYPAQMAEMQKPSSGGWAMPFSDLPPEMRRRAEIRRAEALKPPEAVYPVDLDIGEVADGHHLIVRSIALKGESLLFEHAFVPEVPEEAILDLWPNMNYDADVSPPGWNQACSDAEVYERPVPEARYVWFDFFPPEYDWMGHFDRRGRPDSDYTRNRIARLVLDLETGEARIEK
jgi:hypothetical protein